MNAKQPKFISEEDEYAKFPTTDKQFTDGGGIIWTPRELSDTDIENDIQRLSYKLSHKTAKKHRDDPAKLQALLNEELRRKIRRNDGYDPEIGKDFCMAKAKEALEKVAQIDASKEDLIVEVRNASGAIWGRTILRPCRFGTGSTGYRVAKKYHDPENWIEFQFNANLVRVGSKAAPKAQP